MMHRRRNSFSGAFFVHRRTGRSNIMKVKQVRVKDFMGLAGEYLVTLPRLACLIGRNGIGKTSFLEAIRFGLCGVRPQGELINYFAESAEVELILCDDGSGEEHSVTRIETRKGTNSCKLDGKKINQKAFSAFIEDFTGVSPDKIKILSSGELLGKMKPQEFSEFIAEFIGVTKEVDEVVEMIPEITPDMEAFVRNVLSEEVGVGDVEELYSQATEERKLRKRTLKGLETKLETMSAIEPLCTVEELEEQRKKLSLVKDRKAIYETEKKAYLSYKSQKERFEEEIVSIETSIGAIGEVERPDEVVIEQLLVKKTSCEKQIRTLQGALKNLDDSNAMFEKTLQNLESDVCPISSLIKCHEDKTVAKDEIKEAISANMQGIIEIKDSLKEVEKELSSIQMQLEKHQKNKKMYQEKCSLQKKITELKGYISGLEPVREPELVKVEAETEREIFQIESKLKQAKAWKERQKLVAQIAREKQQLNEYERLCDAFSPKGTVRTRIVSAYTQLLADLLNETSESVRPEVSFNVEAQEGILITMDAGNGADLDFSSLSGGEKTYFLYVIIDVLARLTSSSILFIDELSICDKRSIQSMLQLAQKKKDVFDHILLSSVDHKDIRDEIEKAGITCIEI